MQLSEVAYGADFYALWSAGRIALRGGNAYDQLLLRQSLTELGVSFNDPIIGNMPWSLWLFMLVAMLPFRAAWLAWECSIFCSLLLFVRCCAQIVAKALGTKIDSLFPLLFTSLSFAPLLNNLRWGQSNFLPAIGLVGYLLYESRGNQKQSGLCLSLLLWKPNLQLPLFGFLISRSFTCRASRRVMMWCTIGVGIQLLSSCLMTPTSVLHYPQELARSFGEMAAYRMPSLPLLLSNSLDLHWIRYLIPLAGLGVGAVAGARDFELRREEQLLLINLGLLTSPYCWSHSFLLLYPIYLYLFERFYRQSRLTTVLVFAIAGFAQYAATYTGPGDTYMIILPLASLAVLVKYASAGRLFREPISP